MRKSRSSSPSPSRGSRRISLEPRVLLDAALAETVVDQAAEASTADATTTPDTVAVDVPVQQNDPTREVYFIDARVENIEELIDDIPAGAEIFLLDSDSSGIEQMRQHLIGMSDLDAIHLISHGGNAEFVAGSDLITNDSVENYGLHFGDIGSALAEHGDLLIYGCNVAQDGEGAALLNRLATLSGADVAASDDLTGAAGDWDLEVTVGAIEAATLNPDNYGHTLDLEGIKFSTQYGVTADTELGWAVAADGDWVVAGSNGNGQVAAFYVQGTSITRTNITRPNTTFWTTQFGRGVAIDGNIMVVADPLAGNAGAIAIYELVDNTWTFRNSVDFAAATGASGTDTRIGGLLDGFGESQFLDVDGKHIIVGAPNEGSGGGQGRVFWVVDNSAGGDWTSTAAGFFDEPETSGGNSAGSFGASVSIAKDYFIVSNPTLDTNGEGAYGTNNGANFGRVYVYSWGETSTSAPTTTPYNGGSWTYLTGQSDADGSLNGGNGGDGHRFGHAVDMEYANGRYTIVAGSPSEGGGEIYIYQTSGSAMNTLQAPMNIYGLTGIGAGDKFGASVRVSDARVIVGLPGQADNAAAVFYIEDTDGVWATGNTNNPAGTNIRSFTASQLGFANGLRAGWAIGFSQGNLMAVSAPSHNANDGGVAFIYMRTPVAVADNYSISEDVGAATYNIISNDVLGSETLGSITVDIIAQNGVGTASWNGSTLSYNPGSSFQYLAVGETARVTVTYRLTDNSNPTWTSVAVVTFTIQGANDAPTDGVGLADATIAQANDPTNAQSPQTPSVGTISIRDNVFSDVDTSNDLNYSIVGITQTLGAASSNPSLSISDTGFRTGNINYNLTGVTPYSQFQITVRATDTNGATHDTTFFLNVGRTNETPQLVSPVPNLNATEDVVLSTSLASYFTDPDFSWVDPNTGDALDFTEDLKFTITSQTGPGSDWVVISADGTLSGVPVNGNVGVHTVTVRATDFFGNYVEDTFTITVANTNDAPVLVTPIDRVVAESGTGAATFNFNVVSGGYFQDIDPTSDTITYTAQLIDGTPITGSSAGAGTGSWIRFNGTSFTGTPTDPLGTIFQVRLIATDNHGASAETVFEVGVFPPTGSAPLITDGGAAAGSKLGFSSAVSNNGTWAVYGAPGANGGAGQIQFFEFTGGAWVHRQTIAGTAGTAFGTSVDISDDGSRIVVGAPMENGQRGAVYYYTRTGSTLAAAATTKVSLSDAAVGDRFGTSVALNHNGTQVVVGAPLDDNSGVNTNDGAVYRFNWLQGVTTEGNAAVNKRTPTSDGGSDTTRGDMFGQSVAFDQNVFAVGAVRDDHSGRSDAGSVYVFSTSGGSTKLIKASGVNDADYFGWSVDIDSFAGNASAIVTVGTPGDDTVGTNAGAVYVYRTNNLAGGVGTLALSSTVTAYDTSPLQSFGYSVSLDVQGDVESNGIRMAVGGDLNANNNGAVYAYRFWSGYGWVGQRYAGGAGGSTTAAGNQLGYSVDIGGQRIIGGAPNADRSANLAAGLTYGLTLSGSSAVNISPLSDLTLVKSMSVPDAVSDEAPRSYTIEEELRLREAAGVEQSDELEMYQSEQVESGEQANDMDPVTALLFELRTLNPLVETSNASDAEACEGEQDCDAAEAQQDVQRADANLQQEAPQGFSAQLEQSGGAVSARIQGLVDRLSDLVA